MALQFFDCINNKFINALYYTIAAGTTNPVVSVTAFSGAQPTAAQVAASWSTYSAQYLVHWTSITWQTMPNLNNLVSSQTYSAATPVARAAFRTGTATWGIVWNRTNVTEAAIQGATLPGSTTFGFIVVPVSDSGGNGVIRLTTTSIVSGTSYQPTDLSFRFGRTP